MLFQRSQRTGNDSSCQRTLCSACVSQIWATITEFAVLQTLHVYARGSCLIELARVWTTSRFGSNCKLNMKPWSKRWQVKHTQVRVYVCVVAHMSKHATKVGIIIGLYSIQKFET